MPRKKEGLFDFLDEANIKIMKGLMNKDLGYTEIMRLSPVSAGAFSKRINQLINLDLVNVVYDQTERRPLYTLTETGRRILELLREIEGIYREAKKIKNQDRKNLIK
jgi:DNA-binding HxlR family transcriptional regulator